MFIVLVTLLSVLVGDVAALLNKSSFKMDSAFAIEVSEYN
jgi:hypothetical protein